MRDHLSESEPPLTMLHFCDRTGTASSKNHDSYNISVQRCCERGGTHKKI